MDLSQVFPLNIEAADAGQRLDAFLAQRFSDISRSRWSRFIKDGHLLLNGKAVGASYVLRVADELRIIKALEPEAPVAAFGETPIKFVGEAPEILFEDDDLVVINKPKGLSVHLGAGTPVEETVVAWLVTTGRLPSNQGDLLHYGDDALEAGRPGIVHRLDKPTSGALLICKNPNLIEGLAEQFASKEAGRRYWAWVSPRYDPNLEQAQIKLHSLVAAGVKILLRSVDGIWTDFVAPMGRDPGHRTRFAVLPEGKRSHSRFKLLATNKNMSWVDVELLTGRTHQIRVHLSYFGFPLVGDELYGGMRLGRLGLHAYELKFRHPRTGDLVVVAAPLATADRAWAEQEGFTIP